MAPSFIHIILFSFLLVAPAFADVVAQPPPAPVTYKPPTPAAPKAPTAPVTPTIPPPKVPYPPKAPVVAPNPPKAPVVAPNPPKAPVVAPNPPKAPVVAPYPGKGPVVAPQPPKAAPAPYYGSLPPVKKGDCGALCDKRCALHSRMNICIRACTTCCERCKCVPPGTYGNKEVCGRCYTDMTTHGGRPKCP